MSRKVAVVLFNLGGPDSPEAIEPFLFNLFNDPAIIGYPKPLRWLIARLISRRRAPIASEIYGHLGGRSPLVMHTEAQARALERQLAEVGIEARAFVCMRYWHPMSDAVAAEVARFAPDMVVLLPLYPQFSTTTTGSSIADWHRAAARAGVSVPTRTVCCYPTHAGWITAVAERVRSAVAEASATGRPRVLFSAHGLPKKVVAGGDPYQWQVERTVEAVVRQLGGTLDHVVCYQSRVGPLEWIGPSTEESLSEAGGDGVPVVMVPIAFVSEHSETLVELDIEYRALAEEAEVPVYVRVPTVLDDPAFIGGLASLVAEALNERQTAAPAGGRRICPQQFGRCACATAT